MRTRIDVTFTAGTRSIDTGITDLTIEDIRLIVNETQKKVLCSSMQKDLITSVTNGVVTYVSTNPVLAQGDKITFEIDKGDDYPSAVGVLSEIASGKQAIAAAINAKGGEASATESFSELAQDIQDTPTSGILSNGIVQSEPFGFLDYVCKQGAYPFTEIDDDSVTVISRPCAFYNQTRLLRVKMTALTAISGGSVFQGCSSLQEVNLPNLATISGDYVFQSCSSLQEVNLPNLATISGKRVFNSCSSLQEINLPNLTTISDGYVFMDTYNLKYAIFPKLTQVSGSFIFYYGTRLVSIEFGTLTRLNTPFYDNVVNLRNITIGQDTNINLPFQNWTATNVIDEGQSGIDELNNNLYNNLLTKLYDHSSDGQTRTLRIGWLAKVTAENIAYANAKGWTLTT